MCIYFNKNNDIKTKNNVVLGEHMYYCDAAFTDYRVIPVILSIPITASFDMLCNLFSRALHRPYIVVAM